MKTELVDFLDEHLDCTRRYFLRCGGAGLMTLHSLSCLADAQQHDPQLQKTLAALETWLTLPTDFRDVSRGKPKPHSIPIEQKKEVGLTRDTWKLEVVSIFSCHSLFF